MKIWIDLDNTPHVPFFAPLADELHHRGHEIVLTARDAFQVRELADRMGLTYTPIGRHYGRHYSLKVLGLGWRSLQLLPFCLREGPDIALSHGSRAQVLLCNLIGIPTILAADYEHATVVPLVFPRWLILPDSLADTDLAKRTARVMYYRGLKEDVYAPLLRPDRSALESLGLKSNDLVVVVRPPADEAHYHSPESDVLLTELMSRLCTTDDTRVVLLPRNEHQERVLRAGHPEWFANNKTIVPPKALDGMNLVWYSDLMVSGGGTMNREAAALGVPVYSIFRGQAGALDQALQEHGRLTLIASANDIWTKIALERRDKSDHPDHGARPALTDIVSNVEAIMAAELGT